MERSDLEYSSYVVWYEVEGLPGRWSCPIAKAVSEEDAIGQFRELTNDRAEKRVVVKVERAE